MNLQELYKWFVDGTPLTPNQIQQLVEAGLIVREGSELKPSSKVLLKG